MIFHKIFENIYAVRDFILQKEKELLQRNSARERLSQSFFLCSDGTIPRWKPFAAYSNDGEEDAFVMTKLYSGRFSLKPNLRNRQFLFRGQSEIFIPCKPSMFRNENQHFYIKENLGYQEMFLLMLSHPLVQLLDLGIEICGELYRFEMNLLGLAQHYGCKTALLDLTSDIDVALFFATSLWNNQNKQYEPICNSRKEGILYAYCLNEESDFKPYYGSTSKLSTIGLQVFPRSGQQKGFLYSMERIEDFNENPQVMVFRFKQNPEISMQIYNSFKKGEKLFPRDILEIHWNSRKQNTISERTLGVNKMFNPGKNLEELRKEAVSRGVVFEDYVPAFSEEDLSLYYQAIEDGMWEDFCSKIYIPNDTGNRIKEGLLNARYDERYRWAFEQGKSSKIDYDKGYLLRGNKPYLQ